MPSRHGFFRPRLFGRPRALSVLGLGYWTLVSATSYDGGCAVELAGALEGDPCPVGGFSNKILWSRSTWLYSSVTYTRLVTSSPCVVSTGFRKVISHLARSLVAAELFRSFARVGIREGSASVRNATVPCLPTDYSERRAWRSRAIQTVPAALPRMCVWRALVPMVLASFSLQAVPEPRIHA
jgi:hypothetical protein